MTPKMEVYFRIYEEEADDDKNTRYQVAIHHPPYNVSGEEPLYELKEQRGTIKWQQATLDVSEVKVSRPTEYEDVPRDKNNKPLPLRPTEKVDSEHIEISVKMNPVKRYETIILDNETARKLANDILKELE